MTVKDLLDSACAIACPSLKLNHENPQHVEMGSAHHMALCALTELLAGYADGNICHGETLTVLRDATALADVAINNARALLAEAEQIVQDAGD